MKGRKKIVLLALFAVATLVFSACSKTQTNNDFSVGGIVITDAEFFEISILVNGIKTDYSLDSSGCFNISHLKSGDVITFSKEGYSFNSYTVGGFSVDGIEIVGTKCRYDVLTFFDENYGTVSGAGKYEYGETATLTITPKEHFEIDGIYEKDNLVSSNGEYSFTVTNDRVFVVRFSKKKYPITIEKTDKTCVVAAPESAVFGEEITVSASDDENFVFAYFEIDGTKYYDKTLNFTIKSENTKINAVFLKRLSKPEISFDGRSISVVKGENAVDYTIKIDGRIISTNVTAESFDVSPYVAEVKTYTIAVVANANGWYYESAEGTATFVKTGALSSPVPTASGSVVSWTEVLGATAYDVYVGGEKVLTVTDTTADISAHLQQGENKVKIVATAEGFSDGVSEEIVVIGSASESTGLKTYKLIIENESDYIVFVDGKRTDKKIENGKITLPDTAEKMIIVPDIADLPANEEYVTLFSEIDLTIFKKSGEEYVVETTLVFDSFCAEELTIIGEGEGTNELCEYISVSGKKVYYLNENGKYRPKRPGEE